jgi:hypothetical protein
MLRKKRGIAAHLLPALCVGRAASRGAILAESSLPLADKGSFAPAANFGNRPHFGMPLVL